MKKITTIAIAIASSITMLTAGNSIQPITETVDINPINSGFYIGGGYSSLTTGFGGTYDLEEYIYEKYTYNDIMANAGYKFNNYIAIEGRYWFGLETQLEPGIEASIDSFALYAKPQYPITSQLNIYALVGISTSDLTVNGFTGNYETLEGFSWGLGVDYEVTRNISLFIDYVSLYDEESNHQYIGFNFTQKNDTISAVNIGLNYRF